MQQTTAPLIGSEIDGYRIEALLGHGGMAQVYRGMDIALHRPVAIKVILPEARGDGTYEARFQREARAVASLKHANIVGIYRFGHINDIYYMAMDYVDGADLAWVLGRYRMTETLMPHDNILHVVSQIARALDYAHKKGVIHRDIKPSNIMLDRDGQAYLTDFGLALMTTEGTRGGVFGSPHYIAPEQAVSSAHVVPQSDLYSLGVIIYEMLTGVVPFREGSALQIAMAHISDPPPSPHESNPQLHPAFLPVLATMLAKKPADRYPTGAKLVSALRTAVRLAEQEGSISSESGQGGRLSRTSVVTWINQHQPQPTENPSSQTSAHDHTQVTRYDQSNKPARLLRVRLILLIMIALGIGAGAVAWRSTREPTLAASTQQEAITFMIEGPVRHVDNRSLHVFDVQLLLAEGISLPDDLTPGDVIRMEGRHSISAEGGIVLDQIMSITILTPPETVP